MNDNITKLIHHMAGMMSGFHVGDLVLLDTAYTVDGTYIDPEYQHDLYKIEKLYRTYSLVGSTTNTVSYPIANSFLTKTEFAESIGNAKVREHLLHEQYYYGIPHGVYYRRGVHSHIIDAISSDFTLVAHDFSSFEEEEVFAKTMACFCPSCMCYVPSEFVERGIKTASDYYINYIMYKKGDKATPKMMDPRATCFVIRNGIKHVRTGVTVNMIQLECPKCHYRYQYIYNLNSYRVGYGYK